MAKLRHFIWISNFYLLKKRYLAFSDTISNSLSVEMSSVFAALVIMSAMLPVYSSVSNKILSWGVIFSDSGLYDFPKDRKNPFLIYWMVCSGFPRKPCMIHACLGFMFFLSLIISFDVFTEWIMRGSFSSSDKVIQLQNASFWRFISVLHSLSVPHSPIAITRLSFIAVCFIHSVCSSMSSAVTYHGWIPIEICFADMKGGYLSKYVLPIWNLRYPYLSCKNCLFYIHAWKRLCVNGYL